MNLDRDFCNGLYCPIKAICTRYDERAFKIKDRPIWFMEPQYQPEVDRCINFTHKKTNK